LRFANPSPPSGWIEDFHLQAVDHARHTEKAPPERGKKFDGTMRRAERHRLTFRQTRRTVPITFSIMLVQGDKQNDVARARRPAVGSNEQRGESAPTFLHERR
jgi:hypothetical protein